VTRLRTYHKEDFEQNRQDAEAKDKPAREREEEARREQEKIKQEEQDKALRTWLHQQASSLAYDGYQDHLERRHDGTGEWFVSEVKLWLKQRKEGILWGVGDLGMGKSVLASTVVYHGQEISEILQVKQPSTAAAAGAIDNSRSRTSEMRADGITGPMNDTGHRNAVAHVFLTDDESESQNPIPVFSSLLLQIYESMGKAKEQLIKLMEDDTKPTPSGRNVTRLLHKLTEIVALLPTNVLLVFDALDEANCNMRKMVENLLHDATTKKGPRILIMSRPDVQATSIANLSEDVVFKVPINGSHADISMYVDSSLRNHKGVTDIIEQTFLRKEAIEQQLDELATEIKESSEGM
jgi:hypothetical protein